MAHSIRDAFHKIPKDERPIEGYAETSANFDMEDVQPFLEKLHAFSIPQGRLDSIADTISKLPVDANYAFEAVGLCDGKTALVTIEAFIDDVDAPDLTFIGPEPIIHAIDALLQQRPDRDLDTIGAPKLI